MTQNADLMQNFCGSARSRGIEANSFVGVTKNVIYQNYVDDPHNKRGESGIPATLHYSHYSNNGKENSTHFHSISKRTVETKLLLSSETVYL